MSGYGWIRIWPCLVLVLWLGACTDDTFEEENRSDVVDQTTADSSDELRVNTFMYNVMRTYYYWNDRLPELDTIPDKEPETFFEELVYEGDQFSWLTKEWNGATKSESSSDQYTLARLRASLPPTNIPSHTVLPIPLERSRTLRATISRSWRWFIRIRRPNERA